MGELSAQGGRARRKSEARSGNGISRASGRRTIRSSRRVLRVPTADGRGGPRHRPFFAPKCEGPVADVGHSTKPHEIYEDRHSQVSGYAQPRSFSETGVRQTIIGAKVTANAQLAHWALTLELDSSITKRCSPWRQRGRSAPRRGLGTRSRPSRAGSGASFANTSWRINELGQRKQE